MGWLVAYFASAALLAEMVRGVRARRGWHARHASCISQTPSFPTGCSYGQAGSQRLPTARLQTPVGAEVSNGHLLFASIYVQQRCISMGIKEVWLKA
jgi:hypothetical protein